MSRRSPTARASICTPPKPPPGANSTAAPTTTTRGAHDHLIAREIAEFKIEYALSLIQPWATLVAIGAKLFETRSWQTPNRGWLAIHASKGFPRDCQNLCYQQPYASALGRAGYNVPTDLPRGQVLAVVHLTDCISTNRWTPAKDSVEYAFGNYDRNRFAWVLAGVRRLKQPLECNGALSIWKLPRPIALADLE